MRIFLNGRPSELTEQLTLAELVGRVSDRQAGIAVAVNAVVVPRGSWPATPVTEGDRIEVVTAVQGG